MAWSTTANDELTLTLSLPLTLPLPLPLPLPLTPTPTPTPTPNQVGHCKTSGVAFVPYSPVGM
jgi:hypothetical protein